MSIYTEIFQRVAVWQLEGNAECYRLDLYEQEVLCVLEGPHFKLSFLFP